MRAFIGKAAAPVVALFFLAPLIGEYLLGNVSVRALPGIPFLAPMYGGGALLVREIARRTGRGWPAILALSAAYGVIEAGLVDQSLFNPSFEGHDFQAVTPVPGLGISALNTFVFLVGHVVWSIGIPIAIVEWLTPARRHTPWLGRKGLTATVVVYLLGCWVLYAGIRDSEDFVAGPAQRIGTAAVALLLAALAFRLPRPRPATAPGRPGWVPRPWLTGVLAFAVSSVHFASMESWTGFAIDLVLVLLATVLVAAAARRERWTERHRIALATGAMLTYAWGGFALTSLFEPGDPVRWIGNAGFATGAIALLLWCAFSRRARTTPTPAPSAAE